MTHAMLSNTALMAALAETPEYKALMVKVQAQAQEALTSGVFVIESLGGVEMSLPEVAQVYQSFKSLGQWFFPSDEARKASLAYKTSQECLAIIKKAGYKADAEGIKSLIAFA